MIRFRKLHEKSHDFLISSALRGDKERFPLGKILDVVSLYLFGDVYGFEEPAKPFTIIRIIKRNTNDSQLDIYAIPSGDKQVHTPWLICGYEGIRSRFH